MRPGMAKVPQTEVPEMPREFRALTDQVTNRLVAMAIDNDFFHGLGGKGVSTVEIKTEAVTVKTKATDMPAPIGEYSRQPDGP